MKKKRIMIPLICLVVVVFALITFLIVASNYKKTYVFDRNYKLQITREKLDNNDLKKLDAKKEKFFNEECKKVTFFGKEVDIMVFIYNDETIYSNVNKTLEANKMIWNKTTTTIKNNLYNRQIINNFVEITNHIVNVKFVEYPLWKSKNCLYVTYYFED